MIRRTLSLLLGIIFLFGSDFEFDFVGVFSETGIGTNILFSLIGSAFTMKIQRFLIIIKW